LRDPRQTTPAPGSGAPSPAPPAGVDRDDEEDRRLIAAVQAGDRQALAGLYDLHAPAMLGLALRILRDRGDAEDLVHDVFIEAWHKATSFSRERGRVRTWLLVRVRSRAIDRLRSLDVARRHARAGDGATESAAPHVESPADGPDQRRARAALAALPETQRTVLELAYFEGLSCSEIATRCDAPLGTVKSRLLAGMRGLRRQFDTAEVRDAAR
jgi:RNA polymerase sigma-70 factor (ECF subfamily)